MSTDSEIKNNEQLLQQWQTCVDLANSISQRRDSMNNLFVTINLSVSAAISIIWDIKSIIISIAGIATCIFWIFLILYFRRINSAKYSVIMELENYLSFAPLTKEYLILKATKKHKDGTILELLFPSVFIILYSVLFFIILIA